MSAIEPARDMSVRHIRGINNVLPRNHGRDKELRAIGILSCIGHAQQALLCVLQFEVLVRELVAVDRLAAGAITLGEVSSLDHE
jgi:hypothetical protein